MPSYRRAFEPGGTFFFTVVTESRHPIFHDPRARELLRHAIVDCRKTRPFDVTAIVILPDHLHTIWRLPDGDHDFSTRWSQIKSAVTRGWLSAGGSEAACSDSRYRTRRRGVWQRQFWEHRLRDQDDLNRHADYIHYNPVKHKLANCPHAWPWSSFHRWTSAGFYDPAWCCTCDGHPSQPIDFGWTDAFDLE